MRKTKGLVVSGGGYCLWRLVGRRQVATAIVRNGETTWAKLVTAGKCLNPPKQRRRGDIRKWFLSTDSETYFSPCPFCGEATVTPIEAENQCVQIVCTHCGARGPTAGDDYDATNYWNDQHDAEQPRSAMSATPCNKCGNCPDCQSEYERSKLPESKRSLAALTGSTHQCQYHCAPHLQCGEIATYKLEWKSKGSFRGGKPNYFCDFHTQAMRQLGGLTLVPIGSND